MSPFPISAQFDEALVWLRSAKALRPDSADAWDNVGMTLARKGHWPEAMAHYDKAIELRPDFGEAHRNRALGWLAHGDFERGWPEAEWRLKCRNPPGFRVSLPRWNGEDLGGKNNRASLGTRPGRHTSVHSLCPPGRRARRTRLGLLPGASRPIGRSLRGSRSSLRRNDAPSAHRCPRPAHERPRNHRNHALDPSQAPYLSADAVTIEQWRGALARALDVSDLASVYKIGIAWQGNPQNKIDRWRSFPLEMLAPLADDRRSSPDQLAKGTRNRTDPRRERKVLTSPSWAAESKASKIVATSSTPPPIMSLLDLVVTPETAVAHLAGALAVKCWVALCHAGDWRWMNEGEQSPWYSHIRLFRQTTMGVWDDVFRQMALALKAEVAASHRSTPSTRIDGS